MRVLNEKEHKSSRSASSSFSLLSAPETMVALPSPQLLTGNGSSPQVPVSPEQALHGNQDPLQATPGLKLVNAETDLKLGPSTSVLLCNVEEQCTDILPYRTLGTLMTLCFLLRYYADESQPRVPFVYMSCHSMTTFMKST